MKIKEQMVVFIKFSMKTFILEVLDLQKNYKVITEWFPI